jgi:hypothetical protein
MPKRPNDSRAAAIVFALLVLATLGAFAYSQRVKRDPLVLDRVEFFAPPHRRGAEKVRSFTPNGDCRRDRIRIEFRTTVSDQGVVQAIKPGGRVAITLARDTFLKRYTEHVYLWDGRQRGGGTAPPGRYKLRVKLGSERTLVTPGVIKLHRAPKRGRCDVASDFDPSPLGRESDAGAEARP